MIFTRRSIGRGLAVGQAPLVEVVDQRGDVRRVAPDATGHLPHRHAVLLGQTHEGLDDARRQLHPCAQDGHPLDVLALERDPAQSLECVLGEAHAPDCRTRKLFDNSIPLSKVKYSEARTAKASA